MSEAKVINVGRDFSEVPTGRTITDGPNSGERFREEVLRPALESNDKVVVDLVGIEGVGSSFLEEAFGGLIRERYYTYPNLMQKLVVKTSDHLFDMCIPKIGKYMTDAWAMVQQEHNVQKDA